MTRFSHLSTGAGIVALLLASNSASAQVAAAQETRVPAARQHDDWLVGAAEAAQRVTVTVIMSSPATDEAKLAQDILSKAAPESAPKAQPATQRSRGAAPAATKPAPERVLAAKSNTSSNAMSCVTVCSGISLGERTIVTAARMDANSRLKITLPGGEQAGAEACVIDHYSGLVLLKTDRGDLPKIELAEEALRVGQKILSAAAWGIEKPVISHGIVSATDRWLPGASLPPLVQCDLRITQSSAGAPILDSSGRLAGIVVAADASGDSAGWCYALSVDHVSRLVRNRQENKLVVLQRRQPVMGVQFKPGKLVGTVQVQRVTEGGPAHAAGLREGDEVVEAEGLKIRMAYDVVRQVLHRQPGDKFEMVVRRAAEGQKPAEKKYVLTLGGGDVIEPPAAGATVNYSVVDPKVILKTNNGNIERTDNRRYANDPDARYDQIAEQQRSAVVRLEELQTELQRRDEQIKALEAELEALKAQLKK